MNSAGTMPWIERAKISGWYIVAAVIAVLAFQQWWIVSQQAAAAAGLAI